MDTFRTTNIRLAAGADKVAAPIALVLLDPNFSTPTARLEQPWEAVVV